MQEFLAEGQTSVWVFSSFWEPGLVDGIWLHAGGDTDVGQLSPVGRGLEWYYPVNRRKGPLLSEIVFQGGFKWGSEGFTEGHR